jgi:regulator of sirC expression with transglutaminase-like and TPR domain
MRCRATVPDDPTQLREEGLCLWALQRYSECGESLQAYLDAAPAAPDARDVRATPQPVHGA